jgi:hypothetical protein
VVAGDVDRSAFESMLTEAESPGPLGGTLFDSAIGLAVRRWCAPVLDLPPHASPEDYLAARARLGAAEVNRRFLTESGTETLCVDTGFSPGSIVTLEEMGTLAGATVHEIVRLEQVAEEVAAAGPSAAGFAEAFRDRLAERTVNAVGMKSIAAYRVGLALPGERPGEAEVTAAAGHWLAAIEAGARPRLADVTLQAFLVWCGVDRGLPIQFHVGYGDPDVDLHRCDPLLLTDLIRAVQPTGTPIMLLHNYPFHRSAGYLAQVFDHVFVDVSLALHNVGTRADHVLAELLELAPFGSVLFASDAFGLAELYTLHTTLFRSALTAFLDDGIARGYWPVAEAERIATMIAAGNARRAYRLIVSSPSRPG